jgi:hypothetical protein
MERKKVYISYDYANDRPYKNLLLAWNDKEEFNPLVLVSDIYEDNNLDSEIQKVIADKLNQASVFLVIVGHNTYQSKWVEWEINQALDRELPVLIVKTDSKNQIPQNLFKVKTVQVDSFIFQVISDAIKHL